MSVSCQQLKTWVTKAWNQVSDLTLLRWLAGMVSDVKKAPASTLTITLYNKSLAKVQALLGEKFEVIMLGKFIRDGQELEVKVDLSDTLANLLTVAKFSDSDQKLWSIA